MDERAARDAARSLETWATNTGRAGSAALSRELGNAFGGLDRDAQTALDGIVRRADAAGKAIGAALIGGVSGAAIALEKVGENFEQINRGLIATTAASGAAFDQLSDQATNVLRHLDTSAAALGSTVGTLQTRLQMAADDPALGNLARDVLELSDRFGKINVDNLTAAMVQFHTPADRARETLASLLQTSRETATALPSLVDNLDQFGNVLATTGLNIEQSAHVMGELHRQAIPVQQALLGFEVAQKAAQKAGEPFPEFLRRAAMSMQVYNDMHTRAGDIARDQIAQDVFGQRRWIQAEQGIKILLDTMRTAPDAFGATVQSMEDTESHARTITNAWHEFRNELEASLKGEAIKFIDDLTQKLHEFGDWARTHQQDLANLFHAAATAAGLLITGLEKVAELLGSHPSLIYAVAGAFVVWESITGVASLMTSLGTIATVLFPGVDAAAATTAVATDAAAGDMALAFGPIMTELGVGIPAAAETASASIATSMTAADGAVIGLGSTISATMAAAVSAIAPVAATIAAIVAGLEAINIAFGSATGQESTQTPGVTYGPDGKVLSAGPKAPGAPGGPGGPPKVPFFDAQGRPLNADGSLVGGGGPPNPTPYTPGGPGAAPSAPGGLGPGDIPGGLLTPEELEAKKGPKGPRLPQAPEVPYGPGYGEPPRPGETAAQYEHEQEILEKRHAIDEDIARLNQLEADNNANADDIQKVKNKLLHDQSELYRTEMKQLRQHGEDMEQLGAKIDKDFGISKGLAGIADNLFRFLANLAAAPVYGALAGAKGALGGPTYGAGGLIGIAALGGAFGPQYTPEVLAEEGAGPGSDRTHTGGRYGYQGEAPRAGGGGAGGGGGGGGGGWIPQPGAPALSPSAVPFSQWAPPSLAPGKNYSDSFAPPGSPGTGPAVPSPGIPSLAPGKQFSNSFLPPSAPGAGPAAPTPSAPAVAPSGLSRRDQVASIIIAEAKRRGLNQEQTLAALGVAMQETGLGTNPATNAIQNQNGTPGIQGVFQQDLSYNKYGDKTDPHVAAAGFVDQFIQRGGLNSDNPWGFAVHNVQRPAALGGGGYDDYTGAYLKGRWRDQALSDYNRLAGVPGYAAGGPLNDPGAQLIIAHEGEHVLTKQDVAALGGQQAVYAMRQALHSRPAADSSNVPQPSILEPRYPTPGVGGYLPGDTPPGGPMPMVPGSHAQGPQFASIGDIAPMTPGGPQPGLSMIGAIGPSAGYGSGFQVTGSGLVGLAESLPATAANAAIAAAAAALHGGAIEDLRSYDVGGDIPPPGGGAGGSGGSQPGGAGGGGSPSGSLVSAAINIGMQELNEAISKGGQATGAIIGGLQQTFGPEQFAQSKLAQTSWITKFVGGITGAQPQLPNLAGPQGATPGLTPEQAASSQAHTGGEAPGPGGPPAPTAGPLVHIENLNNYGDERSIGKGIGDHVQAAYQAQTSSQNGAR